MILVQHFLREKECNTCEELETELELKNEEGTNEFILSFEEELPLMYMNVNNEYACLNYFYKDNDPGYVSEGNNNGLDEKGDMVFYTGSGKETILVPNYSVVTFDEAKEAVIEFFKTKKLPSNIRWEEL